MVNTEQRRQLAQDLRQLAAGTIANEDFDDAYYGEGDGDGYVDSADRAVVETATRGWALYSDIPRYRLRGRHKLSAETRREVTRCVLFLGSGREYEWPEEPKYPLWHKLATVTCAAYPAAIAVLLIEIMLLVTHTKDVGFMHPIGLVAALALATAVWFRRRGHDRFWNSPAMKAWRDSGDYDVWPFLRREDYDAARRAPRLLAGAAASPASAP